MGASCTTVIVYFDVNLHTGAAKVPSEYYNFKTKMIYKNDASKICLHTAN